MAESSVPRVSLRETGGLGTDVLLPLLARGVILRRKRIVGLLDRLDADRRPIRRMGILRDRYGRGPVLMRLLGRDIVLMLAAEDVRRVLAQTPEPFAAAKRGEARRAVPLPAAWCAGL